VVSVKRIRPSGTERFVVDDTLVFCVAPNKLALFDRTDDRVDGAWIAAEDAANLRKWR